MANISSYYVSNKNKLISDKDAYIIGQKYRFTVLSPRLMRLEYNKNGVFEDRATSLVINRAFPKTKYSISETDTLIQIDTGVFTLTYVKNAELKSTTLSSNIKAVINGTDKEWQLNSPEAKNLRGINFSIDSSKSKIVLDKGLYSLDGFCVIDDSKSLVLDENDYFMPRDKDIMDLYLFMYNDDFEGCLTDYFTLTGYPNMIPRYALGAWWYKNDKYSDQDVLELVNRFSRENIPLSVFLFGDYWHDLNNSYLPCINLSTVSSYLSGLGIRLGVTIDPTKEIKKGSNEYNAISGFISSNKFSFVPFSNDKIGLYFNVFINNLESLGVSVFSIDYNNVQDKIGLWKLNHYHYGKNVIKGQRGLILSRNPNIATHRYPIMWSGKTIVDWNTLNLLPRYNLQGYNMGISFIAHPIGGYAGGIEEDELYLRYIQFACFSPIFLLASEGGKYYKREPWKWNSIIKGHIIFYMNLRYKLIPYLYSESYDYHKTGHAIVKPFYYDYPKIIDEPLYKNQYFLGKNFFVAPITERKNQVIGRVMKKVFVPSGMWFDFLQGKNYVGDKTYNNFYRDEDYPIFVKAGAIVPLSGNIKEDIPSTLELAIYPLANGEYNLYEDDGTSINYDRGLYMITKFSYVYEKDNYVFKISRGEGKTLLSKRNYILRFKNTKNIMEVNISDRMVNYRGYYDKDDFVIELSDVIVGRGLEVNIHGNDIFVSSIKFINEDIKDILYDLQINTKLKEELDSILFSDIDVREKRIMIRKLRRKGLEGRYIKVFINLLEYIQKI